MVPRIFANGSLWHRETSVRCSNDFIFQQSRRVSACSPGSRCTQRRSGRLSPLCDLSSGMCDRYSLAAVLLPQLATVSGEVVALSAYCAVQLERVLRFHRSFCIKQTHPVKFVRWGRQGVAVGRVWSTCGVDRFNFLSKFKYICVCFCAVCMCICVCVLHRCGGVGRFELRVGDDREPLFKAFEIVHTARGI